MSVSQLSLILAVLGLLLVASQAGTTTASTYYSTFDTIRRYSPSYQLGYLLAGHTVMVNFTTPGTTLTLNNTSFKLMTDELASINVPKVLKNCDASNPTNCYMTFQIPTSGRYRLNLTNFPTITAVQIFYLTVTQYLTAQGGPSNSTASISTLLKATQVIRDKVYKLIYIDWAQPATFTLYPAAATDFLRLLPITEIKDGVSTYVTGANLFLAAANLFDQTRDIGNKLLTLTSKVSTTLPKGYYLLKAKYPETNVNYIRLGFPSNTYPCPYLPQFPDYYSNFQPCVGSFYSDTTNSQQPGYPCLSMNQVTKQCGACVLGYILVNNSCVSNTTCPDRQYFHFGFCLPVDENCGGFDAFTGACTSCKNASDSIVNGVCVPPVVNCTVRQYKVNNVCYNASDLCKAFDPAGLCTSCNDGYLLSNGTCKLVVPNCTEKQYLKDNKCKNIPNNCPVFDSITENCLKCERGYYTTNGICQKIQCPAGQVPSAFGVFCQLVSPLCATYDPLTGDCLSCKNKDEVVVSGACLQVTSPIAGCKVREQLGYGPCLQADKNCETYNIQTGNCEKCLSGWNQDYTGRCTLQNAVCQSGEVSVQGICMQKPQNCARVDSNGLCFVCNTGEYRIVNGQCVFQKTCSSNQYLGENGQCINAPAGCPTSFNPSSGKCITCSNGAPANNGLCCPEGYGVISGSCVDPLTFLSVRQSAQGSLVPTCIAYHPTLGNCLQCNGSFQVDPSAPDSCI